MKQPLRRSRRRQRGVALIIALILVALATILATKLSFDGFLEQRRTVGVLAAEQALHFGLGAEALAADVLVQDLQNSTTLTTLPRPGHSRRSRCRSRPENNPEGEPIGTLQGALEDMQGRFNLNSLARLGARRQNRGSAAAGAIPASARLGGPGTQMGRHRARLDRPGR